MPANRSKLHISKIDEFATWATENRGYTREPTRGDYEILRLRGPKDTQPIIYHLRGGCHHATAPEQRKGHQSVGGAGLVDIWLAERKRERKKVKEIMERPHHERLPRPIVDRCVDLASLVDVADGDDLEELAATVERGALEIVADAMRGAADEANYAYNMQINAEMRCSKMAKEIKRLRESAASTRTTDWPSLVTFSDNPQPRQQPHPAQPVPAREASERPQHDQVGQGARPPLRRGRRRHPRRAGRAPAGSVAAT